MQNESNLPRVTAKILRIHIGLLSLWQCETGCDPDVIAAREATLSNFEAIRSRGTTLANTWSEFMEVALARRAYGHAKIAENHVTFFAFQYMGSRLTIFAYHHLESHSHVFLSANVV